MAIFRKINISFWQDDKVIDDFTPEDKFFMLYLMTNPYTNQIGCYHITVKQMEFETGYNKETVIKLLTRFEKVLKIIKYSIETKELLILNWHKYNWSSSPKVLACMLKEYKSIKNKGFRYSIDTLFRQYEYSIYTQTQEEEEKEEEKESKKEEEIKNKYGEFENVFLTENQYKKLKVLYKDKLNEAINILSSYLASKGKKYKNYYAVLGENNWVYKKIQENYKKENTDKGNLLEMLRQNDN